MTNERVYADLYVHLHAERLMETAADIEWTLKDTAGVITVYFGDECRHSLYVAYNPKQTNAETLMQLIRYQCAQAVRVANIFTRLPATDAEK